MNNPRQKFCVGEEVIIQSQLHLEYNGQKHEILASKWTEDSNEKETGKSLGPGYRYITTSDPLPWEESALRKLPPKSDPWEDCIFNPLKLTV